MRTAKLSTSKGLLTPYTEDAATFPTSRNAVDTAHTYGLFYLDVQRRGYVYVLTDAQGNMLSIEGLKILLSKKREASMRTKSARRSTTTVEVVYYPDPDDDIEWLIEVKIAGPIDIGDGEMRPGFEIEDVLGGKTLEENRPLTADELESIDIDRLYDDVTGVVETLDDEPDPDRYRDD